MWNMVLWPANPYGPKSRAYHRAMGRVITKSWAWIMYLVLWGMFLGFTSSFPIKINHFEEASCVDQCNEIHWFGGHHHHSCWDWICWAWQSFRHLLSFISSSHHETLLLLQHHVIRRGSSYLCHGNDLCGVLRGPGPPLLSLGSLLLWVNIFIRFWFHCFGFWLSFELLGWTECRRTESYLPGTRSPHNFAETRAKLRWVKWFNRPG